MRMIIIGKNERGLQFQDLLGMQAVTAVNNLKEIPLQAYDAVIICTANDNKYQCARYALVNKKHVFISAPLWASKVTEIAELEQLARSKQVLLHVSNPLRFHPQSCALQELIASQALGKIQYCRLGYTSTPSQQHDGTMLDLMPYLLDLVNFWFPFDVTQYNFTSIYKNIDGTHAIIADFYATVRLELAANFLGKQTELQIEIYADHDTKRISYQPTLSDVMQQEIDYFMQSCNAEPLHSTSSVAQWIYTELDRLASEQILLA